MRLGDVARNDFPRPAQLNLVETDRDHPFVLITQDALDDMFEHAEQGFPVEIAGYALGLPLVDVVTEQLCTYIERVVRAQCESTRTHVTLLPSGLHEVQEISESTGTILVGYYHSHPGFTVFQSGEDLSTYRRYYPEPYQIAIVVDSTRTDATRVNVDGSWVGFFGWDVNRTSQRLTPPHLLLSERITGPILPRHMPRTGHTPILDRSAARSRLASHDESQPHEADIAEIGFSLEINFKLGARDWSKSIRGRLPKARRLEDRGRT